ncbi:MAG: bifunctional homocysteine S-methyltransferase/methylenetetrahydrofolate reductase [Micromonosporaceae bacterium]
MTDFTDALGRRVLICDGAMGTMLHAAGAALDRALPELSLSEPKLVATIHESYLSAGADIIQTNTFGANRLWLGDHGFPDKVEEINRAAVRIARAAQEQSDREVFVAGSVSPAVTALQRRRVGSTERMEVIGEQIQALAAEGIDVLILETFGYLDELAEAIVVAGETCDVPIIAQATFASDGNTLGGETPREVASVLSDLPVCMLGTNCTIGPQRMLAVVEDLVRYASLPVSAQPNAGQPRRVGERRFEFSIDGSYFARYLRRFAEAGAALVGGCCGTTPPHIGAAAAELADFSRTAARAVTQPAPVRVSPAGPVHAGGEALADQLASRRFVIAAGITPPLDGVVDEAVDTVTALQGRGVGLFSVAPRENARTRLDSLNMALHLQHQAGVETIATVTTWDKTIMTLQADLLGAHALGLRSIVCTTGSPPVLGDYPAVDGVWEVDSLGLTALLAGLNEGRDWGGLALSTRTSFCIGARINPGAHDTAAEVARAKAKVQAGAHFLVTRPVYELDSLRQMVEALASEDIPVLASVAPLRSFEEADYLAHEVPDVNIPAGTLHAMERAGRADARATGLKLAADLLSEAKTLIGGVVLAAADDDPGSLDPLFAAVS